VILPPWAERCWHTSINAILIWIPTPKTSRSMIPIFRHFSILTSLSHFDELKCTDNRLANIGKRFSLMSMIVPSAAYQEHTRIA
jgi:hypothetical protein